MIDTIIPAFKLYCETGQVKVSQEDRGYLHHALIKAKRNANGLPVTAHHHPIFMLMMLNGDMDKIEPFLKEVLQQKAA
jgi:hypothetical protein